MKERTKFRLTGTLRKAIFGILIGVVALIVVYLATHLEEKSRLPEKAADIGPSKVDRKEKIEHFEFKGGQGNVELRADTFYVGADGLNHLEGNVEVVDFGHKGGQKVTVFAEGVAYDQDVNHFVMTGKVKIQDKDLILASELFDYDKKKQVFKSDRGVDISSERLKGSSRNLLYTRSDQTVTLEGDVELEVKPKSETRSVRPFFARGQKFLYSRNARSGKGEGTVEFHSGQSRGSCEQMTFALSGDENFLRKLHLVDKVRLELITDSGASAGASGGSPGLIRSKKREVEADEVDIGMFDGSSKVRYVGTRGNSRLRLYSETGAVTEVQAETAQFYFDEAGDLRNYRGTQKVTMVDKDKDGQEVRRVSGEEMNFGAQRQNLGIRGGTDSPASFSSPETDLEASEIMIFIKNNDIAASGNVKAVVRSKEVKRPPGLFSSDQPLFVTTRNLRSLSDPERFIFSGDIRVWQEKNMVVAQELTLFKKSGEIRSAGGVKTAFPHKQKQTGKEEKIEVSAIVMNYTPENRVLSFENSCSLLIKNYTISSRSMTVALKKEDGQLEAIEARDDVVIDQPSKQGRGNLGRYNLSEETIVLTGNPYLTDKNKGETRGDKLTFYLSDGKIRVENRERERSETIIKREKWTIP